MGLSIYYSGKLRDPNLIEGIITEAADIANSLHWNICELPCAPGIPVRGIIVQPENCDPLWLTFHLNGNLCNPIFYSFLLSSEEPKAVEEAKQVLVINTQDAGPETHMAIIKFMRYLSSKYFGFFELNDESKYWETADEQVCRKRFSEGDRVINLLDLAIAGMEFNPERQSKIVGRLKKRLNRKKR